MGRLVTTIMVVTMLVLTGAFMSLVDESGGTARFVSGTKVNGVGVGRLTVDEAKARIEGFYTGEYSLTIKGRGGCQEAIAGMGIGYRMEVPEGLKAILDVQNAARHVSGPDTGNSHTIAMTVTCSQEALGARIKTLTLTSDSGITVTPDAHISSYEEGQSFSITPTVQGNNMDEAKITEVITAAVEARQNSMDMDSANRYYQVSIWETDENLITLRSRMNRYRNTNVNYIFGSKKETLGGEIITTRITESRGEVPTTDLEKITTFMTEITSRRDTAGITRVFHTAAGGDVELTGSYGRKIDVVDGTQTLAVLTQADPTTDPVDRELIYAMTVASCTTPDWGTIYAGMDLIEQHVYVLQKENLVWNTPCVTGNISKNYDTPPGIYDLTCKEKDRILRGARKADGTHGYKNHVNYWIPLNGGIGFYGATWRNRFGNTIFQTDGSHGYIDLSPREADMLYDLIYEETPVLCYQ